MEVLVMTFNLRIHVAEDGGNAWPNRAAEAAMAINEACPAIVCTQEGTFAMLQDIGKHLTNYDWLGEGRQGGHEDEHCAVLISRKAAMPVESGSFGLSENPDKLGFLSWNSACPRMCTWIRMRRPDGKEWYVFNTHLDHISEEARTNGIRLIVERMNVMCARHGIPAVLAGDFNSGPDSAVIAILNQAGYRNAYSELKDGAAGCTYHGFRGGTAGEPIDYIFVTPDIEVLSAEVDRRLYNGRYPSDHYPVTARLRLAGS